MRLPYIEVLVRLNDEFGTDIPIENVTFDEGTIVVYIKEEKALPAVVKKEGFVPCEYEERYVSEERRYIPFCIVHNQQSKYVEAEGRNRPCLAVEPWGKWEE